MLIKKTLASLIVATLLLSTAGHTHGIWFAERSNRLALIFGVGAEDLNMAQRLPRVKSVAAYDALQQPVETSLSAGEYLVVADTSEHPAIVTAVFDNGVWSQKEDGSWSRGNREQVGGAVLSAAIMKYTVHLRSPLAEPLGDFEDQLLQIIPDDALLPDKKDSELGLVITYRGKPVSGVRVIADQVYDSDAQPLLSDGDGRVRIRVRNQGLNVIRAAYETVNDDLSIADRIHIVSTLSFLLQHEPE